MRTQSLKLSYCCCVFLLLCHSETAQSVLILTPTMVSLCPGDQLLLTCNTSMVLQRWIIVDPNTGMSYTRTIEIPTADGAVVTPLQVQSITLNFAVTSAPNTLPLISTLTVAGVTNYLNMSRISCLEIDSGISKMISIHILGFNTFEDVDYYLVDPTFGINNTTVMIQFNESNQENDYHGSKFVSYNVTSSSQVEIKYQGRTTFQLVIPYNTQVNVNIMASVCGQYSTPTIFHLKYTNCGCPPMQQSNVEINDLIKIIGSTHNIPVMEGTTVSFSCRPGLLLHGPNSSTCMGNGNWEPDPREVECRVSSQSQCEIPVNNNKVVYEYNSTIEGSKLIFYCEDNNDESYTAQCYGNETWIPNIALITCGDQSTISEGPNSTMTQTVTVTVVTVVVGTLFGTIVTVSAILIALALKIKGFSHIHRKKLNCSNHSATPQVQMSDHVQSGIGLNSQRLVYADLGPSSLKQSTISLSLLDDNNRIEYARLNYNARQEQQSIIQTQIEDEHPADKLLNLDTLLIQLKGQLTTRWYMFGETIGLKKEELEKFTNYSPEQSIVEMLDYWLRNHIGQPTWEEIAGALRQLGFQHLSLEIERLYETGQLSLNETDIVELPSTLQSEQEPEHELLPPPIPPKKQNFNNAPSTATLENVAPLLPPKGASHPLLAIAPPRPSKPKTYNQ